MNHSKFYRSSLGGNHRACFRGRNGSVGWRDPSPTIYAKWRAVSPISVIHRSVRTHAASLFSLVRWQVDLIKDGR